MHLIIGGAYQGKSQYGKECLKRLLGHTPSKEEVENGIELNLHLTIKERMSNDFTGNIQEKLISETTERIELNPDLIITCDEVGLGVIPMEREEREYREIVGKVLQELAKQASRVDRVVAGIAMRIK